MYHIVSYQGVKIGAKYQKKFYVVLLGDNQKVLSTSETFNTKQSAWKNIKSQLNVMGGTAEIQDDTAKKLGVVTMECTGDI